MKIVIADDHQVVLDGLLSCFQAIPGIEVVGTATNGADLIDIVLKEEPDIAVIDITMPGLNGIEACEQIVKQTEGRVKVAILTMHQDREFVSAAFKAGASAFIVKSSAFSELGTAVNTISEGRTYISPAISDVVLHEMLGADALEDRNPLSVLTSREMQTFQLLVEGVNVKEISFRFGISPKTVHAHRAAIMNKLGINNIADLTKLAIRHGITPVD
ncbi:response regulator transcription factor [bacterium]|nr:response regulator transcription factor [bacterium]